MNPASPRILTINGGSSSIKFALFEAGEAGNSLCRILEGGIERIGLPEATLRVKGLNKADNFSRPLAAPNHTVAVGALMDWIEQRSGHAWRVRLRNARCRGVRRANCNSLTALTSDLRRRQNAVISLP